MKLIAETQEESSLIEGLSALLCDLGVDTEGLRHNEAIATSFFSSEDITICQGTDHMTAEERISFLRSIENNVRQAMLRAGQQVIDRAVSTAQAGLSHPDRRLF